MNAHELKTKDKFRISLGHLSEGLPIRYEETWKNAPRKLTAIVESNANQNGRQQDSDKWTLYLASFESWEEPEEAFLTVHEFQTVLKRIIQFLRTKNIEVELM